ncbi:MAG: hypothetical protein O3A53_19435 [Acidobacteria bacterium]|nr:hypothetical protein [Acidobacteriota bacterium]MDA1236955.1 hypothetical protein [Acidobacteriota bacterium]
MSCPAINPELLLAPSEEGYVAYDPLLDRIYRLNPIGALIAELCDGKRTPELIHDLLDPVLPSESRVEIDRWIERGLEAGILTSDADASATGSPLSAQELIALAEKLRDQGKVLPAFICQLRVTELDGENPSTWLKLGEFAHIVDRRDDSLLAYEKYLELYPGDAEVRHIVAALRGGATPLRASDAYVQALYKRFSTFYEENVCGELGYQAPDALRRAVQSVRPRISQASVLDLGCGTGLAGVQFKACSDSLVGVDLSPEMV